MQIDISIHALREEGDLAPYHNDRHSARFLSTPSARRATETYRYVAGYVTISIHALREEGDDIQDIYQIVVYEFLSTPSARRATKRSKAMRMNVISFLSTPSARRATVNHPGMRIRVLYFYPRPPRGGRQRGQLQTDTRRYISIHALREEGDGLHRKATPPQPNFYPRPPRGGRPVCKLLASADTLYFYPRPPRGGRHQ